MKERAWMELGNCRGMDADLFFPERGEAVNQAKAVCVGCEVKEQCLQYALANSEHFGIWGGSSERERRMMRTERYRARLNNASLYSSPEEASDSSA